MNTAKLTLDHYFFKVSIRAYFFLVLIALSNFASIAQTSANNTITWSTVASQLFAFFEGAGEGVNGKLYTFGGYDPAKLPRYTPTSRAYVFDPVANKWTAIASMPAMNGTTHGGVTHAGFTNDGTDIYFAGGYTSNAAGTGQTFGTKESWKYIVAENRYVRLPNLPRAVAAGALEYLNGKLHHITGFPGNPNSTREIGDHYVLDLSNLSAGWKTLASCPNPKSHLGAAVAGGKIYLIGGQHGNDATTVTQKDVHVYDPAANTWTRVADIPVPAGKPGRGHIGSSVTIVGGRIVLTGGETSGGVRTNMVSAYTTSTNTWQNLTPLPVNADGGVAAYLVGNIYYAGGTTSSHSKITYKGLSGIATIQNTFSPVADAFVKNGASANINYGRNDSLAVKTYNTSVNFTRASYLKFPVNVNNVVGAKLRIFGKNLNAGTLNISIYGVSNDSWTENAITWNNAPPSSATILSTVGVNNVAKYYELDVTNFVKAQATGDNIASFVLKDPAHKNKIVRFNSKENAINPPQLIVFTEAPAAVPLSVEMGILEAEAAELHKVIVKSNKPGYTGSGFADYINKKSDFIGWTINKSNPGMASLSFRYSNGSVTNRPLSVEVNGSVISKNLAFVPTGSWTKWSYASINANLSSGVNKMKLTAIGFNGPNIDHLEWKEIPTGKSNNTSKIEQRGEKNDPIISLSPNPTSSIVRVHFNRLSVTPVEITLLDNSGKVQRTISLKNGFADYCDFPVGNLPSGVYILVMRNGNRKYSTRLLINHK